MGETYDEPFDELIGSEEETDGSEPGAVDEDSDMLVGVQNFMQDEYGYAKDDVLLDTGSNCSVFNTKEYLQGVTKSDRMLQVSPAHV